MLAVFDTPSEEHPNSKPSRWRFVSLIVAVVTTLVSWAGPLLLEFLESGQLVSVGTLYALRFLVTPLFWAVFFRKQISAKFAMFMEELTPGGGRVAFSGSVATIVLVIAGVILSNWPVPIAGIPTAESRGIVGPLSPSLILPTESAGIKATSPAENAKLDERPAIPTERPPEGPARVSEAIQSSPVQPEPGVPVTEPDAQSQTAAANAPPPPSTAPNPPSNVRLIAP